MVIILVMSCFLSTEKCSWCRGWTSYKFMDYLLRKNKINAVRVPFLDGEAHDLCPWIVLSGGSCFCLNEFWNSVQPRSTYYAQPWVTANTVYCVQRTVYWGMDDGWCPSIKLSSSHSAKQRTTEGEVKDIDEWQWLQQMLDILNLHRTYWLKVTHRKKIEIRYAHS